MNEQSSSTQRFLVSTARIARAVRALLPKRMQRAVTDFPGVVALIDLLAANRFIEIMSLDGDALVIHPIFHAELLAAGALVDYEPTLRRGLSQIALPGMVAYDVGANVGIFTLQLARIVGRGGKVYAFEPDPSNSRCLARTAKRSGMPQIQVEQRALGDAVGFATFDRRGGAFSGRLVGALPKYRPTKNVMNVPVATIDSLVYDEGYRQPGLIKIDVEGGEGAVLGGAARVLEEVRPIVVCELHSHLGESPAAVCEALRKVDYALFGADAVADAAAAGPVAAEQPADLRHIVAIPK